MSAHLAQLRQPIEGALQDEDRGVFIDHLGAPGAAHIHADQLTLDGGRGEPLVPQRDGEIGEFRKIAGERPRRLRARAFAGVILMGSPSTNPTALRSAAIASSRAASALKALRWMVSTPVASLRSGSDTATPMVLVPRSRPTSAPRSDQCAAASISGRMSVGMAFAYHAGRNGRKAGRQRQWTG